MSYGNLLLMKCTICGSRKHAINYTAIVRKRTGRTIRDEEKPSVCLVCPRCDGPSESVSQ